MNRFRTAVTIALCVVFSAATSQAGGFDKSCEATVAERLAELGVEADVAGISVVPKYIVSDRTTRSFAGVSAWVSLNSCQGSLVIVTNRRCRVQQAYTRGECRVPGLKSF